MERGKIGKEADGLTDLYKSKEGSHLLRKNKAGTKKRETQEHISQATRKREGEQQRGNTELCRSHEQRCVTRQAWWLIGWRAVLLIAPHDLHLSSIEIRDLEILYTRIPWLFIHLTRI